MVNKIYLLTNKINNKIYIGQTWLKLENRMGKSGGNYNNSPYLYHAIKKYGSDNFFYEILCFCETQEQADNAENFYIQLYNSRDPLIGYNIKEGGSHGKHSEESKLKISKSVIKHIDNLSVGERVKRVFGISEYWLGKERGPQTQEKKDNNSEFFKKWHSENIHPMLGKHHTEESKQKISESNIGRIIPKEAVRKSAKAREMPIEKQENIIKAYLDGIIISKICEMFEVNTSGIYRVLHRNNIQLSNNFKRWVGKTHSEETKLKMSESQTKIWEERKIK